MQMYGEKRSKLSIANKVTRSVSSTIRLGAGVGEAERGTVSAEKPSGDGGG